MGTIPIHPIKVKTTARTKKRDYPHPPIEEYNKIARKSNREFTNKKIIFKRLEKRFIKKLEGTQSKFAIFNKWVMSKNYGKEKINFREFEEISCVDTKTSYKYRNWLLSNKLIFNKSKFGGFDISSNYSKLLIKYSKRIENKYIEIGKW